MSEQTVAIRQKLIQLEEQAEEARAARNAAVLTIAKNPADRANAKRLAELTAAIAKTGDEIAAYEGALEHALARDKADEIAAEAADRRKAADRAVQICERVAALNAQINVLSKQLTELETQRDYERERCRAAALGAVSLVSCDRDLNVFASRVGIITDAAQGGCPAYLRQQLDRMLEAGEQVPA